MSKLWPVVKLREVVREEREPVGTLDGSGYPVFGVTNTEGVTITGVAASDNRSKYLRLHPNRFVYNPYRINVGSLGLSSAGQDGIVSPAYVVFTSTEKLESSFLLHFLKSGKGHNLINFHGNRGTVRAALRFEDLCKIEIPLPPLEEQRRIVAKIDELASKIEKAEDLRRQSFRGAEVLFETTMKVIFDFDGAKKRVKDFASVLGGYAFSSGQYTENGSHQIVRIGNVRDGYLDLSRAPVRWDFRDGERSQKYELKGGDILISMTGTRNKRDYGYVAIVPSGQKLLLNQRVGKIALHKALDRQYLYYFLRSPFFRDKLFPHATGTANQANIGNKHIEDVPFKPPENLDEQHRIVAYLDGLQAKIQGLKQLQVQTDGELNALMPSILDKAFKGEL